jgi:hypothetical protein
MPKRPTRQAKVLRIDPRNTLRVDQKNVIMIQEDVLREVLELAAMLDLEQEFLRSQQELARVRAELDRASSQTSHTGSEWSFAPFRSSRSSTEDERRAAAFFAHQRSMQPTFAPGFNLAGPLASQWGSAGHQLGLVYGIAHQASGLMSAMPGYPLSMTQQSAIRMFPGA